MADNLGKYIVEFIDLFSCFIHQANSPLQACLRQENMLEAGQKYTEYVLIVIRNPINGDGGLITQF
jgi:hypothetical protein